ncbi:hypothetical protein ACFJIW_06135 [Tahibacter sp. UC22_41]|uniref:hypothetical protein n=1 Tax=Tahibacter sp. UC22_41 TaxID=3350178 RepID=UPI0036DDBDC2
MDWAFAEGGYLLDFDECRAIVFGELDEMSGDFDDTSEGDDIAGSIDYAISQQVRKRTEQPFRLEQGIRRVAQVDACWIARRESVEVVGVCSLQPGSYRRPGRMAGACANVIGQARRPLLQP